MPALIIHISNGSWVADVANTNISYSFAGATLQEQAGYVQSLGIAMKEQQLTEISALFSESGELSSAEMAQQLYGTTDMLMFEERVIWGVLDGGCLLDEIVEAGEVLLACFV